MNNIKTWRFIVLFVFLGLAAFYVHTRSEAAVPVNKPLGEGFELAHVSLQWLLYLAVALHVGAAFHHHLSRQDWVLRRMLSASAPLQGVEPTGPLAPAPERGIR